MELKYNEEVQLGVRATNLTQVYVGSLTNDYWTHTYVMNNVAEYRVMDHTRSTETNR